MQSNTIQSIIKEIAQQVYGFPQDEIPTNLRDICLGLVNEGMRHLWDVWPWRNARLVEFETPAPVSGVITFASNVDSILCLRNVDASSEAVGPVFSRDEISQVMQGLTVDSAHFNYLPDSSGCRRVKVDTTETTGYTWRAIATYNFTEYTSSNYTTATLASREWENVVRSFLRDKLLERAGKQTGGEASSRLETALRKENETQDQGQQFSPRYPIYDEVGNWY